MKLKLRKFRYLNPRGFTLATESLIENLREGGLSGQDCAPLIGRLRKNPFSNPRGFTFVEVLLTVMIVATMAASLYGVFAAGMKLQRRARQSFSDLDAKRIIGEQLLKDLGRAVFYDFRGSLPDRKCFNGESGQLIFLIEDKDGLFWVRYLLASPESGRVQETRLGEVSDHNIAVTMTTSRQSAELDFVRDKNDFVHYFSDSTPAQKRESLGPRVAEQGLQFFYKASLTGDSQKEWVTSWQEAFLPAAVRVSVQLKNENGTINTISRDVLLPAGGHDEL